MGTDRVWLLSMGDRSCVLGTLGPRSLGLWHLTPPRPPPQGKRVIGEDGSEGYSDLFRENAMLQKENGALRLRVKAMQDAIDAINSRVTHLMSQEANLLLAKAGEWVPQPAGRPGRGLPSHPPTPAPPWPGDGRAGPAQERTDRFIHASFSNQF